MAGDEDIPRTETQGVTPYFSQNNKNSRDYLNK
jgi:hypothetical protein